GWRGAFAAAALPGVAPWRLAFLRGPPQHGRADAPGAGAAFVFLARRVARHGLARLAMSSWVACGAVIGFLGPRSYPLAAALVLVYALLIWLDSSSLTAGAAGSADPSRRGATLALHSMAGYAGGVVGPLMIGGILDWSGGMSATGWGLAFLHVAVVILLGQLAFIALRPRDLAGDRRIATAR